MTWLTGQRLFFGVGIMAIFISWLTKDSTWDLNISEAIALIAVLMAIIIAACRRWVVWYPFSVQHYDHPHDSEVNPRIGWKVIQCPEGIATKFFIGVQLRIQRDFKTIDVRMVEKRFKIFIREAPKESVDITEIQDQERPFDGYATSQTAGDPIKGGVGRRGTYREVLTGLPKGTIMWYEVTALPKKDWNGYLSFQLRRGSDYKGIGRVKVCFKVEPSIP